MREIVTKKWSELQTVWTQLYSCNPSASPFQSFKFLSRSGKGRPTYNEPFRHLGLKELNLVLYKDRKPIAVAALLYKKKSGRYLCFLRGHFTSASYLDFVYASGFDYADFKALMNEVRKILKNVVFQFDRIRDGSLTHHFMSMYFANNSIDRQECACIPLSQDYESWFKSLHKSTRQSLKNRHNRLLSDRVAWSVTICSGRDIDQGTYKEAMRVCAKRYMSKNVIRFGPLSWLVKKALTALLLRDSASQCVVQSKDSLVALLYINGEIAAFASMLVCKDRRIVGIRFAINSRFSRYSPGGLLICAIIRRLTEAHKENELNADELDMGIGVSGGSSYKYAYGGIPRYLYFFSD